MAPALRRSSGTSKAALIQSAKDLWSVLDRLHVHKSTRPAAMSAMVGQVGRGDCSKLCFTWLRGTAVGECLEQPKMMACRQETGSLHSWSRDLSWSDTRIGGCIRQTKAIRPSSQYKFCAYAGQSITWVSREGRGRLCGWRLTEPQCRYPL